MIIIDAGANVGYITVFFSKYLNNPKIYSIEPSIANHKILVENISLLNNSHNIKIYNKALSETPNKFFKIDRGIGNKRDWAIKTKEDLEGNIRGITINEIIKENNLERITCLKIDIEGAERFIFNKENNFDFLSITEILAIEIHDEFNIREEIFDVLRAHGFLLFNSNETTIALNESILNK